MDLRNYTHNGFCTSLQNQSLLVFSAFTIIHLIGCAALLLEMVQYNVILYSR